MLTISIERRRCFVQYYMVWIDFKKETKKKNDTLDKNYINSVLGFCDNQESVFISST